MSPRRALLHRRSTRRLTRDESDLMQLFVGSEVELDLFDGWINAPSLGKHLLFVNGTGGLGKSTLLKRFRAERRRLGLPVALASAQNLAFPTRLLSYWAEDLRFSGLALRPFQRALKRYENLLAEFASDLLKPGTQPRSKVPRLGQAVLKGSLNSTLAHVPGGPLVAELGGMGIDIAAERLRTIFSTTDLEFFRGSGSKLTEAFIGGLGRAARRRRVLLLLDAYDQMLTLEKWLGEFARQLPPNVALVIAGRTIPNHDWAWEGWMASAVFLELKSMAPHNVAQLVRRYYYHIGGTYPRDEDVQKIVDLARGIPLFAATAVEKWARHPERGPAAVVDDATFGIARWLRSGTPDDTWPAYEAAAILRYFNADSLAALLDIPSQDAYIMFREVEDWSFVYRDPSRPERAVHDVFRDALNKMLQSDSPDRYQRLHQRAAVHYQLRQKGASPEDAYNSTVERIYHLIHSGDERPAIDEASNAIDMAVGYSNKPFADSVIALLEEQNLSGLNSAFVDYLRYITSTMDPSMPAQVVEAKRLVSKLGDASLDASIRALIVSILAEAPLEAGIPTGQLVPYLTRAIASGMFESREHTKALVRLGYLSRATDLAVARALFEDALRSSQDRGDVLWQVRSLDGLAYNCLLQGLWFEAAMWAEQELTLSTSAGGFGLPTALKHLGWALGYTGDFAEALRFIKEGLQITQKRQDDAENIRLTRRLAELYDRQQHWNLSNGLFQSQIRREAMLGRVVARANDLGLLGISHLRQGRLEEAEGCLLESLAHAHIDFRPRSLIALGQAQLKRGKRADAVNYFEQAIDITRGNAYFTAEARIGLLLASSEVPTNDTVRHHSAEIEQSCLVHGYNDLLAVLHLFRALSAWSHPGMSSHFAISSFLQEAKCAMIYALRFNRFLLDEVLSAESVSPLVPPILGLCHARPTEGRQALHSIRDWWASGQNELEAEGTVSRSNVPIGIPLAIAEQISRSHEPGDGSSQPTVIQQLNQALDTLMAAQPLAGSDATSARGED